MIDTSEDTRKLLKLFGVTVTEFEDKSKLLIESSTASVQADPKMLLRDTLKLMLDLNQRWSDVTNLLFKLQKQLLENLSK